MSAQKRGQRRQQPQSPQKQNNLGENVGEIAANVNDNALALSPEWQAEAEAIRNGTLTRELAGQGGETNKFVFHSLSEVDNAPLPEWLVKNLIIDGGVGQIFGESGTGKTFFCIDLGMHVCHGWWWFGYRTRKRPVRYMVLEGGQAFALRLRAYKQWAQQAGNTPSQRINGDFQFYVGDLSLMDKKEVESLADVIPRGALLFVDTQAQATAGAQENTADLGIAIANAQMLARLAGCTVVLVHHCGKDKTKGARGWSGQGAAWDFEIELNGRGEAIRTWNVKKAKDAADGATYAYSLQTVTLLDKDGKVLRDCDGDTVRSCVLRHEDKEAIATTKSDDLTDPQRLALDTLQACTKDAEGNPVHNNVWADKFRTKCKKPQKPASIDRTFRRARSDLQNLGLIDVSNNYYSLIDTKKADKTPGQNTDKKQK